MMKKALAIAAASIAISAGVASAEGVPGPKTNQPRENVGVGLGTLICDGHDGLVWQLLATFTNGIFCNQTFAITSGTSGAKKWDKLVMNKEVNDFVKDNMDALALDMARGSGESLDTLAELMGVQAAERATFAKDLQANFTKIYSSSAVTHTQVLENIEG